MAVTLVAASCATVVEPPFELVFHDTDTFQRDWQSVSADEKNRLATEFNDCCQLLLYDTAEFDRRVKNIHPQLSNGVDASLFVLAIEPWRVIFTVDEDPMFKELSVSVLRVVPFEELDTACDAVIRALYDSLGRDSTHMPRYE